MKRKHVFGVVAGVAGVTLAFGLGIAVGQQTPPAANQGVKISPPTALDLTDEIDSVNGRQLRLRVVTIEPGGAVALHSHNGRPAVAYLAQGVLTEHREGGTTIDYYEGQSWTEDKGTTHWAQNKGSTPTVVIAVDVFKP
jgi:quercetin dioxygenase-like cupin family protein